MTTEAGGRTADETEGVEVEPSEGRTTVEERQLGIQGLNREVRWPQRLQSKAIAGARKFPCGPQKFSSGKK